ncbi:MULTISPECIES: helix-hairpin-helix domain-containing protein [unclassified Paenibacillus]|uniref:ComEA family DNA-binding protein n=1 Tax=unclassified Paenibacillus TaxID=185978 RepID=UPI001E2CEC11|nr:MULTISPECIES: helix-hairpin-helix domain-containing protein [unclassified Paenibacillus]CAH0121027.1 ComE operon protein 1 [Paenibacillus sp. CECT 9249]
MISKLRELWSMQKSLVYITACAGLLAVVVMVARSPGQAELPGWTKLNESMQQALDEIEGASGGGPAQNDRLSVQEQGAGDIETAAVNTTADVPQTPDSERQVAASALLEDGGNGDNAAAGGTAVAGDADQSGKINVNEAGIDRLMELPGIGEAKAKAIIAYRERNGKFKSVSDLTKVKGIGPKILEKMRSKVAL